MKKLENLCLLHCTKKKFTIKDFFSKCDQIRRKLRIWSHLLKKSLKENLFYCAVLYVTKWNKEYYYCQQIQSLIIRILSLLIVSCAMVLFGAGSLPEQVLVSKLFFHWMFFLENYKCIFGIPSFSFSTKIVMRSEKIKSLKKELFEDFINTYLHE